MADKTDTMSMGNILKNIRGVLARTSELPALNKNSAHLFLITLRDAKRWRDTLVRRSKAIHHLTQINDAIEMIEKRLALEE